MFRAIVLFLALSGCASTSSHRTIAQTALDWQKCPPRNPYFSGDKCRAECCSGSNWDLTCLGFVEDVALAANGYRDAQLVEGDPRSKSKYGSVERAFERMKAAGRARYDIEKIPPGAAVFFHITGFKPGHIAIYSGMKNAEGSPMIVSTGGPRWGSGIRIESLKEMSERPYWKFLGWVDLTAPAGAALPH